MNPNSRPNKPDFEPKHHDPLKDSYTNTKVNPMNGSFSSAASEAVRPLFARGWKYYAAIAGGVFVGAIAANMIYSMIFRRGTVTTPQNRYVST